MHLSKNDMQVGPLVLHIPQVTGVCVDNVDGRGSELSINFCDGTSAVLTGYEYEECVYMANRVMKSVHSVKDRSIVTYSPNRDEHRVMNLNVAVSGRVSSNTPNCTEEPKEAL